MLHTCDLVKWLAKSCGFLCNNVQAYYIKCHVFPKEIGLDCTAYFTLLKVVIWESSSTSVYEEKYKGN